MDTVSHTGAIATILFRITEKTLISPCVAWYTNTSFYTMTKYPKIYFFTSSGPSLEWRISPKKLSMGYYTFGMNKKLSISEGIKPQQQHKICQNLCNAIELHRLSPIISGVDIHGFGSTLDPGWDKFSSTWSSNGNKFNASRRASEWPFKSKHTHTHNRSCIFIRHHEARGRKLHFFFFAYMAILRSAEATRIHAQPCRVL